MHRSASGPVARSSDDGSRVIGQNHENYDLVFMMLMGIRTAVGRFAGAPKLQDGVTEAADQKWEGDFLARGTAETPAHTLNHDFKFKDYAPRVFRDLRELFGIATQDYMLSLTSECARQRIPASIPASTPARSHAAWGTRAAL